jgi:hypothetical protein
MRVGINTHGVFEDVKTASKFLCEGVCDLQSAMLSSSRVEREHSYTRIGANPETYREILPLDKGPTGRHPSTP